MAQFLSDHRAVVMTTPKEPHHFDSDHNHGGYNDTEAYAALFNDSDAKTMGEASVFICIRRWLFQELKRNVQTLATSLNEQIVLFLKEKPIAQIVAAHQRLKTKCCC